MGIKIRSDCYVKINNLLKLHKLQDITIKDLEEIVLTNDKKRFSISDDGLYIRANQGHSISLINPLLLLKKVNNWEEILMAIHGTKKRFKSSIQKDGLNRMSWNNIHLSKGKLGYTCVISGMIKNCKVFIHIDTKKVMEAGLQFYISDNGVILCPGDKNVILIF